MHTLNGHVMLRGGNQIQSRMCTHAVRSVCAVGKTMRAHVCRCQAVETHPNRLGVRGVAIYGISTALFCVGCRCRCRCNRFCRSGCCVALRHLPVLDQFLNSGREGILSVQGNHRIGGCLKLPVGNKGVCQFYGCPRAQARTFRKRDGFGL